MLYYVLSLIISVFTLIMSIINALSAEEMRFYGTTETWVCLGVSVVLIFVGLLSDRRVE